MAQETIYDEATGLNYTVEDGVATITSSPNVILDDNDALVIPNELGGYPVVTIGKAAFFPLYNIKSVSIPTNVETIGVSAFESCSKLASVTFAEDSHLKEMLGHCFWADGALTEITLPAGLKTLGEYTFYGCRRLKAVYFLGEVPPSFGSSIFDITASGLTFYVPRGSATAYTNTTLGGPFEELMDPLAIEDNGTGRGITAELQGTYLAGKLTYHRKFSQKGQYATICLPFGVHPDDWQPVFEKIYKINDAQVDANDKHSVSIVEFEGGWTTPGVPYLVKLKDDVDEVSFANALNCTVDVDGLIGNGQLGLVSKESGNSTGAYLNYAGTYQKISNSGVQYYTFNADGSFGRSSYVAPFRMCLYLTGATTTESAPAKFSINIEGNGTTGIQGVKNVMPATAKSKLIYTIDGKLVSNDGSTAALAKGIYIKDGKKIVIK